MSCHESSPHPPRPHLRIKKKNHGPALPVGNSAGRGLNPRPERSTPAKYLLTFSLSAFRYRWSKSSSLPVVKESGPALPVGNNAGRGLNPRPERSTPAKSPPTLPNSSPPSPYKSSYFLSSVLCSCVGGSFRSGVQPPTGTKSERSTPVGDCIPDRNDPPPQGHGTESPPKKNIVIPEFSSRARRPSNIPPNPNRAR